MVQIKKGMDMTRNEDDKVGRVAPQSDRPERNNHAAGTNGRREVELRYEAPQAHTVFVAGDFNRWRDGDMRIRRDETGVWKVPLWLVPGRYEYRFIVDGQWQDDPHARIRVPNGLGSTNCVLEVQPSATSGRTGAAARARRTRENSTMQSSV
jgi:1,4-alpha-glucan branching enzyme